MARDEPGPAAASWPGEVTVTRQEIEAARDGAAHGDRVQKSYYVTKEAAERTNAAVFWARVFALSHAQQTGDEVDIDALPDSASALVEAAMWAEVLRLEKAYNAGEPFPQVGGKLKPGPGQRGVDRLSRPRGSRSKGAKE